MYLGPADPGSIEVKRARGGETWTSPCVMNQVCRCIDRAIQQASLCATSYPQSGYCRNTSLSESAGRKRGFRRSQVLVDRASPD